MNITPINTYNTDGSLQLIESDLSISLIRETFICYYSKLSPCVLDCDTFENYYVMFIVYTDTVRLSAPTVSERCGQQNPIGF